MHTPRVTSALALAAVLALAGCAAVPAAAPSRSPSPQPTPTATEPTGPVIAFDGDCGNVLSTTDVESVLGAGARTHAEAMAELGPASPATFDLRPELALGGLDCVWVASPEALEAGTGLAQLGILALPSTAVPAEYLADFAAPRCDSRYDGSECRLARTVDGVWLLARVGMADSPPMAHLESALDAASAGLSRHPAPVPAPIDPKRWELPSCEQLGADLALADILGDGFVTGFWEGSLGAEDLLVEAAGIGLVCEWFTDVATLEPDGSIEMIRISFAADAAPQWPELSGHPDAEPFIADGATEAVAVEFGPPVQTLTAATDGTNTLMISGNGDEDERNRELIERALVVLAP